MENGKGYFLWSHVLGSIHLEMVVLFVLTILVLGAYIVKLRQRQKELEQELSVAQEDLNKVTGIVESEIVGCYIRDLKGNILYANEKFLSLVGRKREEVIGGRMLDMIPPQEVEYVAGIMRETNTCGRVNFAQFRFLRGDGTPVSIRGLGFVLKKQRPVQVLALCWEVEEDVFTAEQIKAFLEPIRQILDCMGDGLIVTDERGYIVLINLWAQEMTGWGEREALGRRLEDVYCLAEPSQGTPIKRSLEDIAEGVDPGHGDSYVMLIQRSGNRVPIFESATAMRDGEDRCVAGVVIFRDATSFVRHQQELLRLEKLETLSLVASGIAHDFNNLLGAILANIGFIKTFCARYENDEELKRKLEQIEKAGMRGRELVHKLMLFAKKREGKKEAISLERLLEENIRFLLAGTHIEVEMEIEEGLCPIWGDRIQMEQVFQNLVLNAREAMGDKGRLVIRASRFPCSREKGLPLRREGAYAKVEIIDSGCGICEDVIPRIFDPYFTTKSGGTGLGLALTYQIVKAHGGHIEVFSRAGEGATFVVYLPCAEVPPSLEIEHKEPALDFSGKSILFLDDDALLREMMGEIIRHLGGEVDVFEDASIAISSYLERLSSGKPYALSILDISLPGPRSGWDVGREILEKDPSASIVISTGYRGEDIKERCLKYGFKGILFKPFTFTELVKSLAKWLC